jgi:hypothetical protein
VSREMFSLKKIKDKERIFNYIVNELSKKETSSYLSMEQQMNEH